MPIYEYRCESCGAITEKMQRMSDAPLVTCEACGLDALKKIISQTSFVLKGSGWYVTDYKSKPSESSGSKASGSSASSTKVETKSEPAAAPAAASAPASKPD